MLAQARSHLGTPWVHQAHLPGVALDCVGLVVETCKALGLATDFVYPPYGRTPKPGQIRGYLDTYMAAIDKRALLPADIMFVAFRNHPMHLAFVGNYRHDAMTEPFSIIHSALEAGRVVETALNDELRSRVEGVWRIPGIV